jgi:hypothetical protein
MYDGSRLMIYIDWAFISPFSFSSFQSIPRVSPHTLPTGERTGWRAFACLSTACALARDIKNHKYCRRIFWNSHLNFYLISFSGCWKILWFLLLYAIARPSVVWLRKYLRRRYLPLTIVGPCRKIRCHSDLGPACTLDTEKSWWRKTLLLVAHCL